MIVAVVMLCASVNFPLDIFTTVHAARNGVRVGIFTVAQNGAGHVVSCDFVGSLLAVGLSECGFGVLLPFLHEEV